MDGCGYLLGILSTQTDMATGVPSGDKCFEPYPPLSSGLLLHRHNFQNLILEGCPQEKVNDIRLLDGQRDATTFSILDAAQLSAFLYASVLSLSLCFSQNYLWLFFLLMVQLDILTFVST